jgi:hypothetical protein
MKKSELWARVAIAAAGSDCGRCTPAEVADEVVRDYGKRFPEEEKRHSDPTPLSDIELDFLKKQSYWVEKGAKFNKSELSLSHEEIKSTPEEVNISLKFAEFLKAGNVEEKLK